MDGEGSEVRDEKGRFLKGHRSSPGTEFGPSRPSSRGMLGKKMSPEAKAKISAALKGRPSNNPHGPGKGHSPTPETRARISATLKGRLFPHSFQPGSSGLKGEESPNWKGGKPHCVDCGKKLSRSDATRCADCAGSQFKPGSVPWNKAAKYNAQLKARLNLEGLEKGRAWNKGVRQWLRPEDHPNWQGGKTGERSRASVSLEYKSWRTQVFDRDDYTCQRCKGRGGKLHADHIERWADNPGLRFDVANGRTLCVPCHYFVTFGREMTPGTKWCRFVATEGG